MINTTTRNANLTDLVTLLQTQTAAKLDVVAPAATMHAQGGLLRIEGTAPVIREDGITVADGLYRPTDVFDEGVASKLGVPIGYLRRLRADRPDLYDANVNGLLHGHTSEDGARTAAPDMRSFFVRTFQDLDGGVGIARAMMSDRYAVIDNHDVLMATLNGINQSGVPCEVESADVTDRRMYVRVRCEAVAAMAPELLRGYRSPFTGEEGSANPTVFAGFIVSNSEVGGGAFKITPRLIVQVCRNGMTITKDAMRAVHTGAKLEEGINWSNTTQDKALELIVAKTTDAVATFLDPRYVQAAVDTISEQAGVPIPAGQATAVVETVSQRLAFTQSQADGILDHFIRGGQLTAGGIMQAVTSYAQTVDNADTANDLEASGLRAMEVAAGV